MIGKSFALAALAGAAIAAAAPAQATPPPPAPIVLFQFTFAPTINVIHVQWVFVNVKQTNIGGGTNGNIAVNVNNSSARATRSARH